jgi:3-isopropylmalate dehydratase small subunit
VEPFSTLTGVAVPLLQSDVNTDQIAPASPEARSLHPDYAKLFFSRWRAGSDGAPDPEFVFNRPQFKTPKILVAGENFGCGSSRESAVWAPMAVGIRCVVARSFADTYRENCLKNGVLPIVLEPQAAAAFEAGVIAVDGSAAYTVDLNAQRITAPYRDRLRHFYRGAHRVARRLGRYRTHAEICRRHRSLGVGRCCEAPVAATPASAFGMTRARKDTRP